MDYDATRRSSVISRRSAALAKTDNTAYANTDLDTLRKLVLDLAEVLIDDVQFDADDKEFSRAFDSNGVPNAAEWRHEFLMANDDEYRATWSWDHSDFYKDLIQDDHSSLQLVDYGRVKHTYFENDPDIVDRSLLRHALRDRLPGEQDPPPVLGAYAPDQTVNLSGGAAIRRFTLLELGDMS